MDILEALRISRITKYRYSDNTTDILTTPNINIIRKISFNSVLGFS